MFSLTCILTKNGVEFLPIEILSKKVRVNNVYFSTIKITSKKVSGNDGDFSTTEITSKKVRGNDVDYLISEITLKNYVEIKRKFVETWSSTYRRNINVDSTWSVRWDASYVFSNINKNSNPISVSVKTMWFTLTIYHKLGNGKGSVQLGFCNNKNIYLALNK